MNLNDFGSKPRSRAVSRKRRYECPEEEGVRPVQWLLLQAGVYRGAGCTHPCLPAGAYTCTVDVNDQIHIRRKDLRVDDLIYFADSLPGVVLREIEEFWTLREQFIRLGYLHRRGYLFYGPPGSGKSCLVHQIVLQIIQVGHVAIFCDHPHHLMKALEVFRRIEPERPVVCVFEDIDALIEDHGDTELLQCLDGTHQIDRVVNLATTNYPEELDRRIVSRPRRFDRVIKIETSPREVRRAYLLEKLPSLSKEELAAWVEKTADLSIAALAELVISVACLGRGLEETLNRLRSLEDKRPSSKEFDHPEPMGFALNGSSAKETPDAAGTTGLSTTVAFAKLSEN